MQDIRPQKLLIGFVLYCLGLALLLAACAEEPRASLPNINSFTASDRVITTKDTSTLSWDVGNATSLRITADTGDDVGDVTGKSSAEVSHDVTTVHTLTATNAAGSVTETVTVNVVTINSEVPADIPGGSQAATLEDAAAFAWQEFIALNWPAVPQTGASGNRETPDTSKPFGAVDPTLGTPLAWETFRHKVEIFPGTGAPHGGANYDALPQYIYNPTNVGTADGQVPACTTADPNTPWNNLDEQSEIGLDQMFAGAGPGGQFTGQQLLFQAKANRVEYNYIFQNGWYEQGKAPLAATASYLEANTQSPLPGSTNLVSFPIGTIELKAAWRQLTPAEMASGRFHTANVRYYQKLESGLPCYQDAEWGLVALHIIHKTPSAPYFIYATFEQADNIKDANGNPVEDTNGNLIANQTANPLEPQVISKNATSANPPTPASIQDLSLDGPSSTPGERLYYVNTPTNTAEPPGTISINKRIHDIPETIISVNETAHEVVTAYNQENGLADSPWLYYKLVNVQYQPIDKPTPGVDYSGADAATYYLANSVVETDYDLQVFSGQFQTPLPAPNADTPTNALITDFNSDGTPFKNVIFNKDTFNMGGCMGCHGNAQVSGGDFSFILLGAGFNDAPEVGGPDSPNNLDKFVRLLLH